MIEGVKRVVKRRYTFIAALATFGILTHLVLRFGAGLDRQHDLVIVRAQALRLDVDIDVDERLGRLLPQAVRRARRLRREACRYVDPNSKRRRPGPDRSIHDGGE